MDGFIEGVGYVAVAFGIACAYLMALGVALAIGCLIAVGLVPWVAGGLVSGYFRELRVVLRRPATLESSNAPAYQQYFFGPATRDLRETVARGRGLAGERMRAYSAMITGLTLDDPPVSVMFTWPALVPLAIGLGAGGVLGYVADLVIVAGHCGTVFAVQAAARLCAVGLRAWDTAWLYARGIRGMRCPWCYEVNAYPRYRCSCDDHQCARLHSDLRPGRYGIFRRRCACGCRLPTLITLGSYKLNAVCTYEDHQMSDETGRFRELVLPLLGGQAAGKTRLMAALLVALHERAADGSLEVRVANAETQLALYDLSKILGSDGHILSTPTSLPHAYAVLLSAGRRKRLLHMFDASGERFRDGERTDELRYLKDTRTFLFVLDPMSVPAFWDSLTPAQARLLDRTIASPDAPADTFTKSLQFGALRMGADLRNSRLAVAISKTDVIEPTGVLTDRKDTDEWARAWLTDRLGLGHLITAMNNEFRGNVRFFFTAARTTTPERAHPSIHPLLAWLLELDSAPRRPGPRQKVTAFHR